MDKPTKWEDYLQLMKFAYNSGYRASLKMSPLKVLYGRKCNIPIHQDNPIDRIMLGPNMLKYMEQMVNKVKRNLKIAQDRKKSYADLKRLHK